MIYTIQENVRIVISLLKQYGIKHIVVSPGGTNIPITQAVQSDPFFKCYSIPDERSAMYFAIGIYLQTGEIVATTCTSAQATRNYIPGLTEAFYKHVPVLAITTSKLERFQYQDYMQSPDQCSMPADTVKKTFDLPPVTDINTRKQVCHFAKEAILELTHRSPGPIQLNIRIDDSQQGKFEETELPSISPLKRYMAWEEWEEINLSHKKILIVVGEHRQFTERQQGAIDAFCEAYDTAVYVNHLSNYVGKFSVSANLLVASGGFAILKPDVLITIGGQTGDYPIYNAIKAADNVEHWRVSEDGAYVDTYEHLTRIFECPDYFFFEKITPKKISEHGYYEKWRRLAETINFNVELPFSNTYVAQQLHDKIPANSIMNFAILNSLRSWSYFDLPEGTRAFSNVSAFGIDGCNSMLFGESMNTEQLCFIVTGDLAFFYDMNVLGIRHARNNIRILLINNGGGGEFKIMTNAWKVNPYIEQFISANGHNSSAKGWAESCGFRYLTASDKNEFEIVSPQFIEYSDAPVLFEVFTSEDNDALAVKLLVESNRHFSDKDKMKHLVTNLVGEKGTKIIRKLIGK